MSYLKVCITISQQIYGKLKVADFYVEFLVRVHLTHYQISVQTFMDFFKAVLDAFDGFLNILGQPDRFVSSKASTCFLAQLLVLSINNAAVSFREIFKENSSMLTFHLANGLFNIPMNINRPKT